MGSEEYFCSRKMSENIDTSPNGFYRATHLDFFKKFKRLKPLEPSPSVLVCFFFSLCLILCLLLLDYRTVNHLNGKSLLITWFKFNDSSLLKEKVGFLEESGGGCDIYEGNWVWDDENYPLYQSKDCMFLDEGFRCSENGRPDNFYTKWRWQPKDCNLPRFSFSLNYNLNPILFNYELTKISVMYFTRY